MFNGLFKLLGDWADLPWWPIVVVVAVFLVWWRAGSLFFLYARVARLVCGVSNGHDPHLERVYLEERELARFRIVTGFRARTLDEARRAAATAAKLGETVTDLARCGSYADADGLKKSKSPSVFGLLFIASFASATLLGGLLGGALVATDRALLRFTASGTHFALSATNARSMRGLETVDSRDCGLESSQRDRGKGKAFTEEERKTICGLLGAPKDAEALVMNTVGEQRIIASPLTFVMLVAFLVFAAEFRSALAAFRMKRRLAAEEAADDGLLRLAAAIQV